MESIGNADGRAGTCSLVRLSSDKSESVKGNCEDYEIRLAKVVDEGVGAEVASGGQCAWQYSETYNAGSYDITTIFKPVGGCSHTTKAHSKRTNPITYK